MPWKWEDIKSDWLAGGRLALAPEDVVDAFNRVERAFGRDWIKSSRMSYGSPARGTAPTLHIVTMGQRIASLDGVTGAEALLERLRQNDPSAYAEGAAIYLLQSGQTDVSVELAPSVVVGDRLRQPDFRARHKDEAWTYVEVTQPDVSEAHKRIDTILARLTNLLRSVKKPFALEVFLRREPTKSELEYLAERIPAFCAVDGTNSEVLPESLGLLFRNYSKPGEVVLQEHKGEEKRPRLVRVQAIRGPTEPHRHVVVRMAFADERAEAFLKKEARQLPTDAPGLIMVHMFRAPGGFKHWEPLLRRRFQPTLHTRVSAICLFESGLEPTANGEAWIPRAKLLLNPHARLLLPSWATSNLTTFKSNDDSSQ